ncbi:hypothetical protein KKR91_12980 [Arthrobacter jiangjiafuii]|uniref:ABC transporter permease n=1 Tax=Arthrobacter jiangjiafuii TaxID=2817475 RepID=A0A975QZQ8_9MICC|nr:hypothetical protein [Arthrobacter jiangjiafuii]MBP3044499.1 hypothetical protein [Arthrobacter jiangjiafuii]QWC09392.1 hypothetical protein KKR91_12980 [Arthrobacter jiangjiafuii]
MSTPTASRGKPAIIWAGLTLGLSVVLLALLMLFISPSLFSGPRDLGVGVVGTPDQVGTASRYLEDRSPGAFAVRSYDSDAELEQGIRDREIVGGFDLSGPKVEVYVASAGSTAISGTVSTSGAALAGSMRAEAEIVDVVPLPAADPTGVGIGGLAFPLVFGGIVPAVAFRSMLPGRRGWIFAGLLGFSVVGGFVVAGVLKYVFGSFDGAVLPVAASVALGISALALPLAGLHECFGGKGFTIAAMTMMFVGNPFAGIATSAQWLPSGVAVIGQLLPPGAAGTLVRSVAYFGGGGGAGAALTLAVWALLGILLWVIGPRLKPGTQPGGSAPVTEQPAAA